jgi:hypothetical protein
MKYILLILLLASCSLTPLEAGLMGAVAGTTTTLYLDYDPDIIVDGEHLQITGAESNAFSFLEVVVKNLWSIILICLLLWLMPAPQQLFQKWRKRIKDGKKE